MDGVIPLSRPIIGEAEVAAVRSVLLSGRLAAGPEVEAFEAEFSRHIGVAEAVAVSSGTSALELALRALDIGPGDEVIVPSFTFIATANAVRLVGAVPVFADIDPKTMCVSRATVETAITSRTAAIIGVHLYGQVAAVDELAALCDSLGLAFVEDAAQALGATWGGRAAGGLGTVAAFSFYPTKNITTGEGGMVTTTNPALADRVRLLRSHGERTRYRHEIVGTNARMTEMAAAIGRVQLGSVDKWIAARRAHAAFYDRSITGSATTPHVAPGGEHAYHQYTIRVDDRQRLLGALDRGGVGYGVYYEVPCHRQAPYKASQSSLPHTEQAAAEVVSIPVRPDLSSGELDRVATTINDAVPA